MGLVRPHSLVWEGPNGIWLPRWMRKVMGNLLSVHLNVNLAVRKINFNGESLKVRNSRIRSWNHHLIVKRHFIPDILRIDFIKQSSLLYIGIQSLIVAIDSLLIKQYWTEHKFVNRIKFTGRKPRNKRHGLPVIMKNSSWKSSSQLSHLGG